jgi:hypothetical protein
MAIAAFEDALSVLTRERDLEQWPTARMNLGVAYRDRLVGDRSDNLERAICSLQDSLSAWTRERNREQWAAARMNLGIAYWERRAGDRQENQERAISAFEDCLSGRCERQQRCADDRYQRIRANSRTVHRFHPASVRMPTRSRRWVGHWSGSNLCSDNAARRNAPPAAGRPSRRTALS